MRKRKLQTVTDTITIYPTKVKHAKYTNSTVVIPHIVKVEPRNINLEPKFNFEKIQDMVGKMEKRINKLETLLKYQNKKIDNLEMNLNQMEAKQENNQEMLDLANDIENKLNLPNIESKTIEFSYIS